MDEPKVSKESVNYRLAAQRNNGGRKCGGCAMFNPPYDCELVQGVVVTDHVCDKWKGKGNEIPHAIRERRPHHRRGA
jgi:hypothetical protein